MQPKLFNDIDISSLSQLIEDIEDKPVSSAALAFRARVRNANPNVVEFFESIPPSTMFRRKTDIIKRASQTTLFE